MPTTKPKKGAATLKILVLGEPVGKIARQAIARALPGLKKKYKTDLTITNAENLAHGIGVTTKTLNELVEAGVDFFTSGNHIWDKEEIFAALDEKKPILLRPANYPDDLPGSGEAVLEVDGQKVLVLNLIGSVFMKHTQTSDPFRAAQALKKKYPPEKFNAILVDMHAEATSEKMAMGHYLDGWASAVWGTHTHIPTSDHKILSGGTAYISDVGMTGAKDSVLGLDKQIIIHNFFNPRTQRHEVVEKGTCEINAILLTINSNDRKAQKIEQIHQEVEI